MNLFARILIVVAAILEVVISDTPGSFARETGKFSTSLYQTVASSSHDNVVISPVSVQTALGFAYMGAAGATAEEMSSVLHLDSNQDVVADNYKTLLEKHAKSGAVKIANKMYLDKSFSIKEDFTRRASEKFFSSAENIDTSNGAKAAEKINSWVESNTNNKIQNLVSAGAIQGTPAVLINAVHFKAFWEHEFKRAETFEKDFWTSDTKNKQVLMMHQMSVFSYGDFDGFKAIRMPYKDTDFSLLVLLPHEREGLSAVEAKLGQFDVKVLCDSLKSEQVSVSLPKFKTEYQTDLATVLTKMGMTKMFSSAADFSKLSSEKVQVGKVVHKAIIEVDEKGTEAAAATVVVYTREGAVISPNLKEFKADHPFIYILADSDGHIFFMGRYVQ